MKERELYTIASLELHLFFLRIMKEHAIFLAAGFTPVNANFSRQAEEFKVQFENLLIQAVRLGDGIIRPEVLNSCELFTDCTLTAEQQTQNLTGIRINQRITQMEMRMTAGNCPEISVDRSQQVKNLNQKVLLLLNRYIRFKESILELVCSCRMFTVNYPTLIKHILREAKHYQCELTKLENGSARTIDEEMADKDFWNQIMMEHALFMRGLLDPCENELIVRANSFAEDYAELLDHPSKENCNCKSGHSERDGSLEETLRFRDFKTAASVGIQKCEISSIIVPLLADHILREANHYIRILK